MLTPRVLIHPNGGSNYSITSDLISVSCSDNLNDSNLSVHPGVCEQNATIVFYDRNQIFHTLAIRNSVKMFFRSQVIVYAEDLRDTFFVNALNATLRRNSYLDKVHAYKETAEGTEIIVLYYAYQTPNGLTYYTKTPSPLNGEYVYSIDTMTWVETLIGPVSSRHAPESYIIGTYILNDIKIEGDNNEITVSCIDHTYILDEVYIDNFTVKNRNVDDILKEIFMQSMPNETFSYMDTATHDRCLAITVYSSYMLKQTARSALSKVCDLALINIVYHNGTFRIASSVATHY